MIKPLRHWTMVLLMALCSTSAIAADQGWDSYKSRFLTVDGRIQDTGNNNVSHTEGQGFAMLLAVHYDDRSTFDRLWSWTQSHLKNKQNGLFYWRYTPTAADPVADKNNASDGDVMIAWALLKAGEKWRNESYLQASDSLQKEIVAHNVTQYAGHTVMLPGANGFNKGTYLVLNPSYFIFPAWADFSKRSRLPVWHQLIEDGMVLLSKTRFGDTNLPSDWVALNADGTTAPAMNWPSRFSYDAIRIPLYVYWYDRESPELSTFRLYWHGFPRLRTPAWVDVLNNHTAPYMMNGGLLAVRDLAMGDSHQVNDAISPEEDYYSASLHLLANLARVTADAR
ncbi:glycosyl hydrolase family 8 [Lonsdalea quercina]|uniref:glycosyl hydrolase family 8 n=1 Tax=Lonsdalea quercina TaxID=71657 RepID=UPI0039756D04